MKPIDSIDLGVTKDIQDLQMHGSVRTSLITEVEREVLSKDITVASAEQAVQRSISRFETAMENLAHKAEVTHDKVQFQVQKTQDWIHMPRQKINQWDDQFSLWARTKSYAIEDGMRDLSTQLQMGFQETVTEVKRNPRPYLWAAGVAGLFAGLLFFTSFGEQEEEEEE